ncbi:GTP-binding protein [Acinetobacter tianfuensis]|uniref:GTP-binding protein n=1 Tax=Acinetobacter tianfuensis TaxID=2419603 RepID=A0A3A8EDQ6_9GAMM|nr:GTP-binding protein [Acinetobacter tianfuensis]RKG33082.1 GTP-binding protein [Acinetobacter tianfuensis]
MLLQQYKIVFGGKIGAGKSAAIKLLSDIPLKKLDASNFDEAENTKQKLDIVYGEMSLNDGAHVGLYGTPGHESCDFIWPKICQDSIGIVLLIDHMHVERLKSLEFYLRTFEQYSNNIVIGITHLDLRNSQVLKIYRDWLMQNNCQYPLFTVDAREKDDVLMMVETLIALQEVRL